MCMRISVGIHVDVRYINILLNIYIYLHAVICRRIQVDHHADTCAYCVLYSTSEIIYMWSYVCVYQLAFMLTYDLYQYISENIYIYM